MFIRTRQLPQNHPVPPFIFTQGDTKAEKPSNVAPIEIHDGIITMECEIKPIFDGKKHLTAVNVYDDKNALLYTHAFDCIDNFTKPPSSQKTFMVAHGGIWPDVGSLSLIEPCFLCGAQIIKRSQYLADQSTDLTFVGKQGNSLQQAIEQGAITQGPFSSFWCTRKTIDSQFIIVKLR